jgi:8-oxo-dGTP diphosphatase
MSMPDGIELRCSAVVIRFGAILLLRRPAGGDWVLPGGTPRPTESMGACARRECLEETGLQVEPSKVAFVLEVLGPDSGARTVDMVFWAKDLRPSAQPQILEPGLEPEFVRLEALHHLDLRPPLAGHLRRLAAQGGRVYAPYLANLWRPPGKRQPAGSGENAVSVQLEEARHLPSASDDRAVP